MSGTAAATLQVRLNEAEAALHALLTGAKASCVQYGGLGGSQTVNYTQANIGDLRAYIADLKRQLGVPTRRRAIGLRF